MDRRFLPARNHANAFWTNESYISLQASLDKQAAATSVVDAITAETKAIADRIYNGKIASANEIFEAAIGPAKVAREQVRAVLWPIYEQSIAAPYAVYQAAKDAAEETLQAALQAARNTERLINALAQEEFQFLCETANDEECADGRWVLFAASRRAGELCKSACETAHSVCRLSVSKATGEFHLATKGARADYDQAMCEHEKALATVSNSAEEARTLAAKIALEERTKNHREIDAERSMRLVPIDALYAIERRERVLRLQLSRQIIDKFFDWLSQLASPKGEAAE